MKTLHLNSLVHHVCPHKWDLMQQTLTIALPQMEGCMHHQLELQKVHKQNILSTRVPNGFLQILMRSRSICSQVNV